jgi:hypothetical protein
MTSSITTTPPQGVMHRWYDIALQTISFVYDGGDGGGGSHYLG